MAKSNPKSESIYNLGNYLNEDKMLPIYFFYGEDTYTINNAVKAITKVVEPLLDSDFDKQIIDVTKETSIPQIVDVASAFPFGGEKKFLLVKNFEKIGERKTFADYVTNPADFTIMVVTQIGKKVDTKREPYNSLASNGYLFEAHEMKGAELQQWVVRKATEIGLTINSEDARVLVDLIGEHKSLIEMNLQKLFDYLGDDKTVTITDIENLSSVTKEYTVFNLQDAIAAGDKPKALEVLYNLIDNGNELVYVIAMLTKFISTIAQYLELSRKKISDYDAAKEAGVSFFYFKKCMSARYLQSHMRLRSAANALLNADLAVKTTSTDSKTVGTILISEIMK